MNIFESNRWDTNFCHRLLIFSNLKCCLVKILMQCNEKYNLLWVFWYQVFNNGLQINLKKNKMKKVTFEKPSHISQFFCMLSPITGKYSWAIYFFCRDVLGYYSIQLLNPLIWQWKIFRKRDNQNRRLGQ